MTPAKYDKVNCQNKILDLKAIDTNIAGSIIFGTDLLIGDQLIDIGKEKRFSVKGDVIEVRQQMVCPRATGYFMWPRIMLILLQW